jgi:hypothetical protein
MGRSRVATQKMQHVRGRSDNFRPRWFAIHDAIRLFPDPDETHGGTVVGEAYRAVLDPTATRACAAVARLSGSVSEIWPRHSVSDRPAASPIDQPLAQRGDLLGQVLDP